MKFKMYVEQIWHYSEVFEADSFEEASKIADEKRADMLPTNCPMTFSDEHCEIEEIK